MEAKTETKKLTWIAIVLMSFTSVWSFENVINGYHYYGKQSILAWLIIFAVYFVPYALMVGEMASVLKSEGGVSSWIDELLGSKFAYYASWTIWAVHLTYIAQKPQQAYVALGWLFYGDDNLSGDSVGKSYDGILRYLSGGSIDRLFEGNAVLTTIVTQIIYLLIFTITVYVASKGITAIKAAASVAGMASFTMSILFIIMIMAAPSIRGTQLQPLNINSNTFDGFLSLGSITNLSVLVFAVGGCEKLSSYVNKTKNPSKDFSKAMIILAIMMAACAGLGTIALMRVYGDIKIDITNGSYKAFLALGEYYGVGSFFSRIYGAIVSLCKIAVLIMSIDAPLRMLITKENGDYLPKSLYKTNKHGAFVNGYKVIFVAVSILIVIPIIGSANANVKAVNKLFIELNSIVMPIRYLWVFFAYILLKKKLDKKSSYTFIKNKIWGQIVGWWCFALTAISCIMKMLKPITKPEKSASFSPEFLLTLNSLAPIILLLLGLIMPILAKSNKSKIDN